MTKTFYESSLITKNKMYQSICNQFFENINIEYKILPSPSLCHGKSGVLL